MNTDIHTPHTHTHTNAHTHSHSIYDTHTYPPSTNERDTLSEVVVLLRTVVTFVTWLISRTEFSSSELVLQRHFW